MSFSAATQILSFENFGSLESHLKGIKDKYSAMIKSYEETLGFLLRDTKVGGKAQQKVQDKWALEMQRAMATTPAAAKDGKIVRKQESKPMFGNGKDNKNEKPEVLGEWISIDPMSLFIGPRNKGLAEVYFEAVNLLKENVAKLNMAISVCSSLRARSSAASSTSLIVSFVNDLPIKIILKPAKDSGKKKYTMAFTFAIPSVAQLSK
jgi:hypothetical protein